MAAFTAVGLIAAIAVPTIAFGNARSNLGSFNFEQVANTPFTAQLVGANEVPPSVDLDGRGAAAVTFDIINPGDAASGAEGVLGPQLQRYRHANHGTYPPRVRPGWPTGRSW